MNPRLKTQIRRLKLGEQTFEVFDDEMSRNYDDLTPVSRILEKLPINGNPVIFDVGANIGITALAFSTQFGNGCRVVAFEPHPLNYERLKKNIELDLDVGSRIETFPFGLSDRRERCYLSIPTSEQHARYDPTHNQINSGLYSVKGKGSERFECELVTLDEFVSSHAIPRIDFIKIDVEGVEFEVLLGGESTIGQHRPSMLLEYNDLTRALSNYPFENYLSFFARYGYDVFGLPRDWNVEMLAVKGPDDISGVHDLVCLPREELFRP
jgi:FkbM family methyltransferase